MYFSADRPIRGHGVFQGHPNVGEAPTNIVRSAQDNGK